MPAGRGAGDETTDGADDWKDTGIVMGTSQGMQPFSILTRHGMKSFNGRIIARDTNLGLKAFLTDANQIVHQFKEFPADVYATFEEFRTRQLSPHTHPYVNQVAEALRDESATEL